MNDWHLAFTLHERSATRSVLHKSAYVCVVARLCQPVSMLCVCVCIPTAGPVFTPPLETSSISGSEATVKTVKRQVPRQWTQGSWNNKTSWGGGKKRGEGFTTESNSHKEVKEENNDLYYIFIPSQTTSRRIDESLVCAGALWVHCAPSTLHISEVAASPVFST